MTRSPSRGSQVSLSEIRSLAAERAWQRLAERVRDGADGERAAEPEVDFHFADALWRLGEPMAALEVVARIEPTIQQAGDRHLQLNLINVAGMAHFEAGHIAEAEERFRELLERATAWESDDFSARAANNLGVLANVRGRRDEALLSYQRALVAYQKLGSVRGLAQTNHNLGICYRDLGFRSDADHHFERAIKLAGDDGSSDVVAMAETERAMLRVHWGDPRLATALAQRAIRSFEAMSDPLGRADAIRVLAAAARAENNHASAAGYLQEALGVAEQYRNPLLIAEIQLDRGALLEDVGRTDEAIAAYRAAAEHFRHLNSEDQADQAEARAATLQS